MGAACSSSSSKYTLSSASEAGQRQIKPPPWVGLPAVITHRHKSLHATMVRHCHENSWDDFEFMKVLGRGKFGEVVLTKHVSDSCYYAVKKIGKQVSKKNSEPRRRRLILVQAASKKGNASFKPLTSC